MSSSKSAILTTVVVFFLFVFQQVVDFTSNTFRLVDPYWIFIVMLVLLIGNKLHYSETRYKSAFYFMMICVGCSFLTIINGSSIGECASKAFMSFMGFITFVYIDKKEIDYKTYLILYSLLYVFSYFSYFIFDEFTRRNLDSDLFGHSSSNTIAMYLNVALWFLYVIQIESNIRKSLLLAIYSILNVYLILLQGSRAGLLVSLILCFLIIGDIVIERFNIKAAKLKVVLYTLFSVLIVYYIVNNMNVIEEFVDVREYQGVSSYEEDARGIAMGAFFSQLNIKTVLFGMPDSTLLLGGLNRTFNAFIDFWRRFGILPFIVLIYFVYSRIKNFKQYSVPLVALLPILFYSLFESLWGGTLWDMLIYISLFYSKKVFK